MAETIEQLLASYNRQCPDCRRMVAGMSERMALRLLKREASAERVSRIRLNNAIAIWQSASKRAVREGK